MEQVKEPVSAAPVAIGSQGSKKQGLMDDLELLVLEGLVAKMRAGEATSSEFNTATQLLAKSGALARTGGAGKSGDEWMDMALRMPDDEFERFVEALRERRADARAVATSLNRAAR